MADSASSDVFPDPIPVPKTDARAQIVDALMQLAAERRWDDISISDIADRAGVSLAEFRERFPSKGAILGAFSRQIDKKVLEGTREDLVGEPVKERLFDVLMRRLDALGPYKAGVESVVEWARRDPLAAAALNRSALNSMRFMLEAAGVGTEGVVGAVKLQGLVIAWGRVLDAWLRDDDSGLARTMAVLDRELTRGASIVGRVEDVERLASPLRSIALSFLDRRRGRRGEGESPRRPWSSARDDGSAAAL